MNQETTTQHFYRGVFCACCRQPIPLPAIVDAIESSLKNQPGLPEEQSGRAFVLRCRACDKEMPYRIGDIARIEGTPRSRVSSRTRDASKLIQSPNHLSRAANA